MIRNALNLRSCYKFATKRSEIKGWLPDKESVQMEAVGSGGGFEEGECGGGQIMLKLSLFI